MFDVGFSELFLVAVVALLVLGPERLPRAARLLGVWSRRARAQWDSVKSEFEQELADDELARNLRQGREHLRRAQTQFRDGGDALRSAATDTSSARRATEGEGARDEQVRGDPADAPQRDPLPGRPTPAEHPERGDPEPTRTPRRDPGQPPDQRDPEPRDADPHHADGSALKSSQPAPGPARPDRRD